MVLLSAPASGIPGVRLYFRTLFPAGVLGTWSTASVTQVGGLVCGVPTAPFYSSRRLAMNLTPKKATLFTPYDCVEHDPGRFHGRRRFLGGDYRTI